MCNHVILLLFLLLLLSLIVDNGDVCADNGDSQTEVSPGSA